MKKLSALAALLGGILWLALNLALVGAWERGNNFPTYEFLNALRPLPLALFAFALYGLYRAVKVGRVGFIISLAGFFLLAAGAAIEFWIGGGVRDGEVDTTSLVGWLTYLVGYLVLSIGLIAFGIAFNRTRVWGTFSSVPFITGIVWASWFVFITVSNVVENNFADLAQYLFALLWIGMGVLMTKENFARVAPSEN
ncbi:hypothetical protein FBQ82_08975 [Anaerolineae bacterium CFX7]|nr:hypothetical protein [Anaerolineae bacterium CFX7]